MKSNRWRFSVAALVALTACAAFWGIAQAGNTAPVTGAVTAKAGVAVVSGRFVKLSAAGVVQHATAVTDKIIGVCDMTQASANAQTRYSPIGTQAVVTSGEAIAVGDLLTGGSLGKAFVLDEDDASTQQYGAVALTAASGADESVTCIVQRGAAEKHLAYSTSTTVAADELVIPTPYAVVVKTTGADAEALTLADGVPGQILVITLGTAGGGDGTLTPATATGWATMVFTAAGDTASLMFIDGTVGWVILGTAGVATPPEISV